MPAKILAFDPNRRVPPRRYTPIAMRGRLLVMPRRPEAAATENRSTANAMVSIAESYAKKGVSAAPVSAQGPFLTVNSETAVERSS